MQKKINGRKELGDADMAVCGLPIGDPAHAENIMRAALEIRDFMEKRNNKPGNRSFHIRIGVHSGPVVAGIVGIKKLAYDIWGDTVNTAARMGQNSEPGKVNISETCYELVKDKFQCTYRGEITAKNKGSMKMYFLNN
ncbi:MAG: adenylate/guanylate cyclase domain-containing protein [Ferruginibacter sp.]